jgi:protein-S-isoprenylcysteine O-methyltransferase Ste14
MSDESGFRFMAILSLALTLPIALYYRIRSQATGEKLARREEGLFILVGLRLLGLFGFIAFATALTNPLAMAFSFVPLPGWLRWIGAIIGIFGVPPLLFWTFRSLGKNLTDTVVTRRAATLVTHGPYRWVRHPFYDVILLWGISLGLLTANWLLALVVLAAFAMLAIRTRIEERKLIERFGGDYRAYMERTGKFLPRFK